jgi:hypothetical protein
VGLQVPANWQGPGGGQVTGGFEHTPVTGLQIPAKWQRSGAAQVIGVPGAHAPFRHLSAVVHVLPSSHIVPFGFLPSAGQLADVPLQDSAISQSVAAGRQTAPALPAGCWHVKLEPLHLSAVHGLPSSKHAVRFALGEQVPANPVKLHAPHSSVHGLSQHTPLAQNPEAHWLAVVHVLPRDGS